MHGPRRLDRSVDWSPGGDPGKAQTVRPVCDDNSACCIAEIALVALVTLTATSLSARQDAIDRPTIERIRQEGLERSKVMEFYSRFVTVDGPRLTGSPAHKAAAEWARQQFAAMGLQGAQLEPFEFGRGWELTRLTIEMVAPRYMPLVGYAEGWSAPTAGVIEASPVFIGDQTADQVEALKGTLKGAIVLTQPLQSGFVRADRAQPATSDSPVRIGAPPMPPTGRPQADQRRITEILRNAGAGALIRANAGEHGTMFVLGRDAGAAAQPSIVLAAEHYNMVARMLAAGLPVKLRVEIGARYLDADRNTYNVLAEIPGSDPKIKDEIVLVGGHLDSWHSSPGATDNADGAAAVLEAARILSAIGARPRRTIRFALWSGEEQGLLGSKAYATGTSTVRQTPQLARSSTSTSISIRAPARCTAGISRGRRNWPRSSTHGSRRSRTSARAAT